MLFCPVGLVACCMDSRENRCPLCPARACAVPESSLPAGQWGRCPLVGRRRTPGRGQRSRLERLLPFLRHPLLLPSPHCVVSALLPGLPCSLVVERRRESWPSRSWTAARDERLWVALEGGSWLLEESHGWRHQKSAQALCRGWRGIGVGAAGPPLTVNLELGLESGSLH